MDEMYRGLFGLDPQSMMRAQQMFGGGLLGNPQQAPQQPGGGLLGFGPEQRQSEMYMPDPEMPPPGFLTQGGANPSSPERQAQMLQWLRLVGPQYSMQR